MSFIKGQPRPPNAGRKPGSKNKKRVPRVVDFLAENDINPVAQILSILGAKDASGQYTLKNPKDRADIWLDLLSYCQGKPKEVDEFFDDEPNETDDIPTETLLSIVKNRQGSA